MDCPTFLKARSEAVFTLAIAFLGPLFYYGIYRNVRSKPAALAAEEEAESSPYEAEAEYETEHAVEVSEEEEGEEPSPLLHRPKWSCPASPWRKGGNKVIKGSVSVSHKLVN